MPSKMTQVSSAGTKRNTKKYNKIKLPTWFLNQWSKTTAKVQGRSRCAHTHERSMVFVTSPATSYWDLVFLNSMIARIPSAKVSVCVCVCVCSWKLTCWGWCVDKVTAVLTKRTKWINTCKALRTLTGTRSENISNSTWYQKDIISLLKYKTLSVFRHYKHSNKDKLLFMKNFHTREK